MLLFRSHQSYTQPTHPTQIYAAAHATSKANIYELPKIIIINRFYTSTGTTWACH